MYWKGEQRSLSACQSCGYQKTRVQVWGGGGRCQSSPWCGKLCWWGQLQSSLILICLIQNFLTFHVTWPCCHCAWPSGQSLVLPGFTWSLRPERSQRRIVITSSSQTVLSIASSSLLSPSKCEAYRNPLSVFPVTIIRVVMCSSVHLATSIWWQQKNVHKITWLYVILFIFSFLFLFF